MELKAGGDNEGRGFRFALLLTPKNTARVLPFSSGLSPCLGYPAMLSRRPS